MRSSAAALFVFVLLATASPARAADDVAAPDVKRLLEAKRALHWNVAWPGKSHKYGHAEALVAAHADKVRDIAVQFGRYHELHRKFAGARVVAKERSGEGEATDVYMRLPVKIGPFTFDQWEVMRFGPTRAIDGGAHVIEGRGVRGTMKEGHMVITIKPVGAKHALITVDLLLVPTLPAPRAIVEEELRDAALDLVNGLKDKAQGFRGAVVSL